MFLFYRHWLPSLDNQPADEEDETSKEQNVHQVTVVSDPRHRSHSTHC